MKIFLKKCISLLIVLLLLMGIVPISTVAKEYSANGFTYVVENNVATITGYAGNATKLVIPSELNGYKVTSIGVYAFEDCNSLTSITIPNSVTSIGYSAFYSCDSLTSITIPNSVTSIGYSAFRFCGSLTSITIPNSVTSIGDCAFEACDSLTSVTIPNGVTSIGVYAFSLCDSLTSITIPNSVTSIGEGAFRFCGSLTSITIPNSVTSIGDYAFFGCDSLTSITIPNSVTSIGDDAFNDCDSLTSITVSENNKNYSNKDGVLFNKEKTTLICYPDAKKATSYVIPNSVTSIGDDAFNDCDSLTSITIPNSVTSIGDYAFKDCDSIKEVYYAGSKIEWDKISIDVGNDSLINAKIHYNYNSSSVLPDTENSIKNGSYGSNLTWALDTKKGVLNISGRGNMEKINPVPWKDYYSSIKKVVIKNGVTSINEGAFANCVNLTDVLMPNSIKSIGLLAFESCLSLESLSIPSSVEKIYSNSSSIRNNPFYNCKKLTDIYYGGTQESWLVATNGKNYAPINVHFSKANNPSELFEYKEQISKLWKGGAAIITSYKGTEKNVTVPQEIDGYTIIGLESGSFTNCDWIESITLPATINKIEDNSLPSNGALTDVYFTESWITWNKVQLGYQTEQIFENKVKIHCETGVYTSATDRIITVGEKVIYLIYTNDPNDTVVSIQKSNEKTLKLLSTTDGNNMSDPLIENIIPAKNYCTVVVFEGVGNGIVDISFSVKAGGETKHFYDTVYCYDESLDVYNVFRAENIEDMKWEGDLVNDKNEVYCGWSNGIILSDFNYYTSVKDGVSGYRFELNAYNGKNCNGVCEVFDAKGDLKDVVLIEPYRVKAFDGVCSLVENTVECFSKVVEHRVSYKTTRTETVINVFVPDGGYIRVTNDMALSSMCAFYNIVDIVSYAGEVVGDLSGFLEDATNKKTIIEHAKDVLIDTGLEGRTTVVMNAIDEAVKLYMTKGCSKETLYAMCKVLANYAGLITTKQDCADFGKELIDATGNAFLQVAGLDTAFDIYNIVGNIADATFELEHILETSGSNKAFWIHSNVNIKEVKQILENAGIIIDTRNNVDPEAILHTYKVLADDEIVIDLGDSGVLNEYETYEISLIKDGYKVQPNDKVQVSIELSQDLKDKKNLTVLRENDDGTLEIIESRIENGMIVFEVDHFCRFVIGTIKNTIMSDDNTKEETIDNDNKAEKAPENSPYHKIIIIAVMVVLVGVAVLVIVLIKNKRKRSEIN